MDKLVKDGFLSKTGRDTYTISKSKVSEYDFSAVKEEMDGQVPQSDKAPQNMGEDYMYMKALYHALPMNYVTVAKLQSKLEGEANQTTVRKLIDKMTRDGYIETKSNRRLGKRVIHSSVTEKKLIEVKKAIDNEAMDVDINEPHNESNQQEIQTGSCLRDTSTCGGLHSIGSDLTRTKGKSDINHNGSIRSYQTISKQGEQANTPTSRAEPVESGESFVPGNDKTRANRNTNADEVNTVLCSRSSQDKRFRKASTVKEPILQYVKRQKSAL